MDAIKNDIKPWSPDRREIGQEVLALIEPELRRVLTEAYSSIGARLDDIPDTVYQPELAKFKQIATGDFSDAYFKSQTEIARNIAKTSSVTGYFATGYSIYAGGLLTALLRKTRWKRNKQEAYVRSLLSSIFHDVAVATSVVMTDLAAATLKERAELERVQAQEAEASRQTMAVLNEALSELSSGNLSYRITAALPEKSESMRRDFNTASATLSNVIEKISTAVQDIRHGMNEISSSTNDLSRRTERQAASIEETAAALEQITATVQHASDAALQAKHAASTAATDATQSGAVMKQAESAMSDIAGSSQQIGQIVSVIDEIAFQTNLLALNAGVEAARAGESGKGFAVVASEVRSLAQRASEAARDIRTLIGTSSQQVKHGVSLVEDTSETLSGIVGRVSEIDTLITGIAASSREQAGGLKEINSAVAEMDQFTQQNAAMVEQSTAVAAGVQDLALELSSLIAHFTVANQTRAALPALDMKRAAA